MGLCFGASGDQVWWPSSEHSNVSDEVEACHILLLWLTAVSDLLIGGWKEWECKNTLMTLHHLPNMSICAIDTGLLSAIPPLLSIQRWVETEGGNITIYSDPHSWWCLVGDMESIRHHSHGGSIIINTAAQVSPAIVIVFYFGSSKIR